MRTSEETTLLFAALHKVQTDMPSISADSKNDYFDSLYADLTAVWNGVRAVLSENGLAVIQGVKEPPHTGGLSSLTTRLCHTSGQWIEDDGVPLIVEPNKKGNPTAQMQGSAITYARRQGLSAMLGIITDEDDDGAQASQTLPSRTKPKAGDEKPKTKELTGPIKTMTEIKKQMEGLSDRIDECGTAEELGMLEAADATKGLVDQLEKDWPEAHKKYTTKLEQAKKRVS